MKRFITLVLVLVSLNVFFVGFFRPVKAFSPDIIVQYHMWYDTRYGVESAVYPTTDRTNDSPGNYVWQYWDVRTYGFSTSHSPDDIKSDGWKRYSNTIKESYPLIGLYDPDDMEILRWHIKLAKAAGIKAFAPSLYVWGGGKAEARLAEVFRKMLSIAQEENFLLAWEIWWGGTNMPDFFNRYKDILKHPNFYRVDGKPLVWIAPSCREYNFFFSTSGGCNNPDMHNPSSPNYHICDINAQNNVNEFDQVLQSIENKVGFPIYWAINNGCVSLDVLQSSKSIVKMTSSNLFWDSFEQWDNLIENQINKAHQHEPSIKIGTHVYPGFDEDLKFDEVSFRPNPRYRSRNGGETLRLVLEASKNRGADFIFLESWNDFGESTAIEPGIKEDFYLVPYQRDYYKDLRLIADFNGFSLVPPSLPPEASIDPLVRNRLKHQVTFRAKAGLANTAQLSNGVIFGLARPFNEGYADLFNRNILYSDGVIEINQDISEIYGKAQTVLLNTNNNGDSGFDQAYWLEAGIYIDDHSVVNLIDQAPTAHWHSSYGTIPWGSSGPNGTATYRYDVTLSNGNSYAKTLYVHPDYSSNGFSHGGYRNLDIMLIPRGDLNYDGLINSQDLKILLQNWGDSPLIPEADLNSDGIVNGMDFGMMVKLVQ